jgi:hypothetical protein
MPTGSTSGLPISRPEGINRGRSCRDAFGDLLKATLAKRLSGASWLIIECGRFCPANPGGIAGEICNDGWRLNRSRQIPRLYERLHCIGLRQSGADGACGAY